MVSVVVTYFGAPALKFSNLLEIIEVGTIYSHEGCTRPTRGAPVALDFKGVQLG